MEQENKTANSPRLGPANHAQPPSTPTPTTPRKRKPPANTRLQGIKRSLPPSLSIENIKKALVERLDLGFTPDDWQLHAIRRILQGYDSMLCAGTGYGKSLIFEGLAALGPKGNVVMLVCPLKALEHDQVRRPQ